MTNSTPARSATRSVARRSRRVAWSGLTFVALLLLSAGMASVPGGSRSVATVRDFYSAYAGTVAVAQLIGLAAATMFAVHARALADVVSTGRSRLVQATGMIVAASAALTAVPVLALTAAIDRCSDRVVAGLAASSDYTDVLLFAAMSVFAVAVARALKLFWVGATAVSVAFLCTARSVLIATGSTALDLAAPLAFISLVAVVSIHRLVRRHAPSRSHCPDTHQPNAGSRSK